MAKIGIDLGTTNSACCAWDSERHIFHFLHFGVETLDYFPTAIAYEKASGKAAYIGAAARDCLFSEDYDVYERFKLSLGRGAHEKNGRAFSPMEVTRDFLREVIRTYETETGEEVESLVITVPDVWKNEEQNKTALDNLTELVQELGYTAEVQAVFESEPVAAAAYYCVEVCRGQYEGHIVVIDYGGGTLDLTLCRVEQGKIRVLRRCGNGGGGETGCAGVAFDEAMTQRLVERLDLDREVFQRGSLDFCELQGMFERAKIASAKLTREALSDYYISGGCDDRKAFSINTRRLLRKDCAAAASDIAQSFEAVNQTALQDALSRILQYCQAENVDIQSQQSFRVLMVGGFSNLYCVESAVRSSFRSIDGGKDLRFDNGMRLDARSTAIAQGAALIAADMISIIPMCQCEIGFYCFDAYRRNDPTDPGGEIIAIPLIERGRPLGDYREPCYCPGKVEVRFCTGDTVMTLYFDEGSGKVPIKMDKAIAQIFPNLDDKDNTYQIGFSMTRSGRPILHIRDRSGEVHEESLHRIQEKIALLLLPEEGKKPGA